MKPEYKLFRSLLSALICLLLVALPALAREFPGRAKYPGVPTIESEALYRDFKAGKVVIVDVRSTIEFELIHPVGAIHIPSSERDFEEKARALAAGHPDKKIAFYCNGYTCMRSYEATDRASRAGIGHVFAYDAGTPEWAERYPADTELLGRPITDPDRQLISEKEFTARVVDFNTFQAMAAAGGAMVIDVRGHEQRSRPLPGFESALPVPLDDFIANFVKRKANQNKKLLIFDQVGRQVRWLDYYMKNHGYQNYFFLKGGATAVLGEQQYIR